jgi:hypothetical protein
VATTFGDLRPSALSRRSRSLRQLFRRELVDVVQREHHHTGVRGERLDVPVVQRGVGVFLRIDHPHEHVDQLDQPVDDQPVLDLGRVVVRQVE